MTCEKSSFFQINFKKVLVFLIPEKDTERKPSHEPKELSAAHALMCEEET